MKKRKAPSKKIRRNLVILGVVILILLTLVLLFVKFYPFVRDDISVKPILLKLSIFQGGETSNNIKITNNQDITDTFEVSLNNLDGLSSIDGGTFILNPRQSKKMPIYFKDTHQMVGVYPGQLIVKGTNSERAIPIMLTVRDENNIFAIIHSPLPKYNDVYPGGKLGIEIKVVDVTGGIVSPSIQAEYSIQNFEGDLIWADEGSLILGESWTELVDISKNLAYGDYVFTTLIEYKGIKSISGYLFSISKEKEEIFPGNTKFFFIAILTFVVVVLGLFFYFIKTRDDLLLQLRKQQGRELKENLELVNRNKVGVKKLKSKKLRKRKIKELSKVKKVIIKNIKTKHKVQNKEIKKIKGHGKKDKRREKITSWKKQGYNLVGTEKEMKKISKSGMPRQIKNLEKEGYKTNFLNK